ncbi:hypothetical protein CARUB_v10002507mg [Capsella rubella]|uniref:AT-hook motif nuclear-localized protein n=1 Tax=Capsella rubella TaxID=81985 RepID=R0FIY8_9BRAS|nr:uncharacterized protein LOC17883838 [Capsella rubella]EOA21996.1 hypothetical protein CARUB_v10002507mg [Capsella rubella]
MSEDSSVSVDQTQPRNGGQGRGMNPFVQPPIARRTLIIQNQTDVVTILSALSRTSRQGFYIMSGSGYVSQATVVSLPSRLILTGIGRQILYMSGWFQPMISITDSLVLASRRNGILHVSLSGLGQSLGIAQHLIADGPVEVNVVFLSGPGSEYPPDAPAPGPIARIRLQVNYVDGAHAAPQAPVEE